MCVCLSVGLFVLQEDEELSKKLHQKKKVRCGGGREVDNRFVVTIRMIVDGQGVSILCSAIPMWPGRSLSFVGLKRCWLYLLNKPAFLPTCLSDVALDMLSILPRTNVHSAAYLLHSNGQTAAQLLLHAIEIMFTVAAAFCENWTCIGEV